MLGKTLRQLSNEPDGALSDPLVAVETDAGQRDELGDGMRSETVERVQQAGSEAEREERRLQRHALEVIGQVATFFIARGLQVDRLEASGPCEAHLLGAAKAHPVVPGQRPGEELGERAPHRRIEPLGIDGDLVRQRGVGRTVTPSGQISGRHLVERHRCRESLRIGVPPRGPAKLQERIQVLGRARPDVLRGGVREREVEHDEGERLVRAARGYPDVVGLQIPMRDAFLLQPLHDAQQLPPEAFQKVEREPAFLADAVREGVGAGLVLGAGHRDEQRCVAGQLHVAMERDDVRMTQQSEHLALAPDASVERGFEGDLEHTIAVLVAHLEGDGGGAPAEASFHAEAMLQPVARIGVERMNDGFLLLAHLGELALCVHD